MACRVSLHLRRLHVAKSRQHALATPRPRYGSADRRRRCGASDRSGVDRHRTRRYRCRR
jgi:hypothetical protein